MDADSIHRLTKLENFLDTILRDYLERNLPLRRIVFLSSVLKLTSNESDTSFDLSERIMKEQRDDGGWIDCEDTAWIVFFISESESYSEQREKAICWLKNEQMNGKGWGFCKRDYSNIPITSQILYTIPELRNISAISWLENEWSKDLNSPINLNYKGAWYLLVYYRLFKDFKLSSTLYQKTVNYLLKEQREDGGWGPWKNHPAPSDAFITGICTAALAEDFLIHRTTQIEEALKKSITWFLNNQIENGLFPTHYIEEGSAWCYFGWKKAYNCLG
ncbi:MAG TPA: prenyltransferase/squalene oxidase repeat-containing protein [Bacteroidales bacterium]|nr:prenyltransferase/squalene oxidase repeat-containing protein [Bacteroidales bacterium]